MAFSVNQQTLFFNRFKYKEDVGLAWGRVEEGQRKGEKDLCRNVWKTFKQRVTTTQICGVLV